MPALLDQSRPGGGKAARHEHAATLEPAALPVAGLVEGCDLALGEAGELGHHFPCEVGVPVRQPPRTGEVERKEG
jgi:hypothetical protein